MTSTTSVAGRSMAGAVLSEDLSSLPRAGFVPSFSGFSAMCPLSVSVVLLVQVVPQMVTNALTKYGTRAGINANRDVASISIPFHDLDHLNSR